MKEDQRKMCEQLWHSLKAHKEGLQEAKEQVIENHQRSEETSIIPFERSMSKETVTSTQQRAQIDVGRKI
jgi:hypothetical protein